MAREVQVTIDCADPARLAEFWAEVLGYRLQRPPPGFETWDEALDAWASRRSGATTPRPSSTPRARARVFFQRVPEGKQVKNRVHLDVRAAPGLAGDDRMAALEAEADRLVALGARRLARVEPAPPMEAGHLVMADPEGNEFCLD